MAVTISHINDLTQLLESDRAIVLVWVGWSRGPYFSRNLLTTLEETVSNWSPNMAVNFYILDVEAEEQLSKWYENKCLAYQEKFTLHGHGWGPFWWMRQGQIVDCVSIPWKDCDVQQRSIEAFAKCDFIL